MPEPDRQLIQWIAERLKYRELPQLIGREFAIASLKTVEADTLAAIGNVLPDAGRLIDPDEYEIKYTLGKHGLIDLTLNVPQDRLDASDCGGVELLDSLGFIMDALEVKAFDEVADLVGDNFDDPTLLGELEADLQEGQTILRLLLRAEGSLNDNAGSHEHSLFPQNFSVVDACLTNAASVWLHRYFIY